MFTTEKVIERVAEWMARDPQRTVAGAELISDFVRLSNEPTMVSLRETAVRVGCSESYLYHNWKTLGGEKIGGKVVFPSDFGLRRRAFDAR
jgi:hypothetical protein